MEAVQVVAIVLALAVSVAGIALVARTARHIVHVVRLGQPAVGRTNEPAARTVQLLKESLGHSRLLKWSTVGVAHWFVFVGFGFLFFTLVHAYGQLVDPHFALPVIGHWWPYELVTELVAVVMLASIFVLITIRLSRRPDRLGRRSRFAGSTMWQGYYVEWTIVAIGLCILTLRGLEGALAGETGWSLHYPVSYPLAALFSGLSTGTLETTIVLVALLKILVSMAWFVVIGLNATMGVAWHRFTAFFNVWFRRYPDGSTSLGPMQPMYTGGKPVDFEDPGEDDVFGVGKVEDFTWKNILDFTTCTECGRCQSQCPAWNTGKPLSPKLLVTTLRDHAYAKAPYLLDGSADTAGTEAERPLVGTADEGGVIDPDVLWSCTSCGACVEQCPVDIEHVDHIMDLRRYQVLIETSFPNELNGLFKNLEKSGNPWGVNASKRMEWTKTLPFEVKQVGVEVEDLSEVDWLFWVGCAGAFEDRAKKTTQAVAELLHTAGVSFAVLGDGETCTGDPARRSGNEFLFQMLAQTNAEVFKETGVTKVVATCAHCFNTLKNEYAQVGVELEVVHHTQLLNRLVREGRLTPVAANGSVGGRPVTYHDPCYLGRHNQVYSPPRELIEALPDLELREMPRSGSRSFCCGAGGARMWMEERIGKRVNVERTEEALSTGADTIAVGCPFCRVMLSDGVTAAQQDGGAEGVQVLDVAQLLLEAVRRGQVPDLLPEAEPVAARGT